MANYVTLPTSQSDDLHYSTFTDLLEHHKMSVPPLCFKINTSLVIKKFFLSK